MHVPPIQIKNCLERASLFIHEHPTVAKVLRAAGIIAGVGLFASAPFFGSLLGKGFVVAAITGGPLLVLISSLSTFALELLTPPHHDMKNRMFKEGVCDGGKLFYENDVPILSLDADRPAQ